MKAQPAIPDFEALFKINEAKYLRIHRVYESRGRAIPDGAKVRLTDWAIQNGLHHILVERGATYTKVRNCIRPPGNIGNVAVRKEGNQQPEYYWAGFWREIKPLCQ